MSKIGPLTPKEAKRTLAHRFTGLGDRLRQLGTKFGLRPHRVFLVWGRWSGAERGDGDFKSLIETEILPTPLVESLDGVAFSPYNAGTVEVGTVRVSQISAVRYSEDMLVGRYPAISEPGAKPIGPTAFVRFPSGVTKTTRMTPGAVELPEPFDFFYEIVEDGRGDDPAVRRRFRPANDPMRRAGKLDWIVVLERASEDRSRDKETESGLDVDGEAEG
jgi:hypothetical protein